MRGAPSIGSIPAIRLNYKIEFCPNPLAATRLKIGSRVSSLLHLRPRQSLNEQRQRRMIQFAVPLIHQSD